MKRELLDASPRLQTSEMLSAAPGFFVDHEDGEGLGNDVYLRGFDLDHGSGIEMRLGSIPINIPNHIQGQGYADVNFIIPEVVRSVRVLEGPYDPRQGDAAIVGSAYFDLGVAERGYQVKGTYGSFNQMRLVGIAAPKELGDETFVAFSLRKTNGFGENRAAESGSVNAQYGFDLGVRDHLKLLATAYGSRASLAGVVRQDQVDAGQIGYYDSYPTGAGFFAGGQGVQASRVILGADFDHVSPSGGHFELAPWFMWTDFRRARTSRATCKARRSIRPSPASAISSRPRTWRPPEGSPRGITRPLRRLGAWRRSPWSPASTFAWATPSRPRACSSRRTSRRGIAGSTTGSIRSTRAHTSTSTFAS